MAARLSSNRIAWSYTDTNGNVWRVSALKALTDQNKLGGTAAAGTVPARPNWGKMRRITVSNAAGHTRVLPVYDLAATILGTGSTIDANFGDASETFDGGGAFINETRQGGHTTRQST